MARRLLDLRNLDELSCDERAAERRAHRIAVLVDRVGFERREDVVARELLADVEHVRAHGAGRQRAVAHLLELRALPQVHRDRDDLGAVFLGEPRDGDRGVEAARIRQDDSFHDVRLLGRVVFETLRQGGRRARAARDDENRVVAGDGADGLGQPRTIERLGQRLRLAAAGPHHEQLLDALDAAAETRRPRARARVSAVSGFDVSAPGRW